MMKRLRFVMVMFCAVTVGVPVSACNDVGESTSEEDRLIQVLEAEGGKLAGETFPASSKDDTQETNGAGQCCWGHCNNSGAFYNPYVSSGCRDWVVNVCHSAGLAFNPNGDAWWGGCP